MILSLTDHLLGIIFPAKVSHTKVLHYLFFYHNFKSLVKHILNGFFFGHIMKKLCVRIGIFRAATAFSLFVASFGFIYFQSKEEKQVAGIY